MRCRPERAAVFFRGADEGVGGTAGGGAGATKSGGATKGKGSGRKQPRTTLKENLPEIAAAMAERAKAGSYLHARALTDLVEASEVRRQKTRRDKRLVEELLERLEGLGCGCGGKGSN